MKSAYMNTLIAAAALCSSVAFAQDRPMQIAQMDMKMHKPMTPAAMPAADADKEISATQAGMAKMQQQMDKIAATTNPAEREKLLKEHMKTMQDTMKSMRSMQGPAMKSGAGAMPMGDKPKCMDMQKCQDKMETRMDMMQMMMEQMMQRDQAMKPMPHM